MSKFHSICPEKIVEVFCCGKKSFPAFFRTSSQRVPLSVGKLQGVLSVSVVALLEELFEVKFSLTKQIFYELSAKKESWNNCLRHLCQNCFTRVNWNFLQRSKIFNEKFSYHFFVGKWEKFFGHLTKKSRVLRKKFHEKWEICFLFFPKRLLEKIEFFCGKKSAWMKKPDLRKKFRFSVGTFFHQICRKNMRFSEEIWSLILFCKNFCFRSIKQSSHLQFF